MNWLQPIVGPFERKREERRRQWRESQQRVRGKRPALSPEYVRQTRIQNLQRRFA